MDPTIVLTSPASAGFFVSSLYFFSFQQCSGLPQTRRESAADVSAMQPLAISQIDLPISITATVFHDTCSEVIAGIDRTANVGRLAILEVVHTSHLGLRLVQKILIIYVPSFRFPPGNPGRYEIGPTTGSEA